MSAAEDSLAARPARGFRALRGLLWILLRVFFRQVEVEGPELLPADRGVILVSWHPNGLVDPALILGRAQTGLQAFAC